MGGDLAVAEGDINEAMECYERALESTEDDEIVLQGQVRKQMGLAYLESGQGERAISTFEDVLEDLSPPGIGGKQVNLLKAEVWNCMARAYKRGDDLPQAKNYAKLALGAYKSELGENNPTTLRNVANIQLLLLEEAEVLEKSKAKPIIDAAKYEMEGALDAFISLGDLWAHRLDVASLQTNLGFVAVWQGKPKKARKLLRQIQEIELPEEHPIIQRIELLEEKVEQVEVRKKK